MTNPDDDVIIEVLRGMLAKLIDIHGAIEGLTFRIMALSSSGQRHEMQQDEVATDLAWSHQAAAEVPDTAPPGSRADAASLPSPAEKWKG